MNSIANEKGQALYRPALSIAGDSNKPFTSSRQAALALLTGDHRLSRKAGQFLGQLAVDPARMGDAQAEWLVNLLDRAGLPPLSGEV